MTKLFIICGHGDGDPGACANGYTEADLVRRLAARIKELGGDAVTVGDPTRNWYRDNLISSLDVDADTKVVELHMDSGPEQAHGGHVIIKAGFEPDAYDTALADLMLRMFPGRSTLISQRSDLANPNRAAARGINYRLVENGFISNPGDVETFTTRMDELARGYLDAFGIPAGGGQVETRTSLPWFAVYKPNGNDYMVWCDGSQIHALHHPDELQAVQMAYASVTGEALPVIGMGTPEAPWFSRLADAFAHPCPEELLGQFGI